MHLTDIIRAPDLSFLSLIPMFDRFHFVSPHFHET